MELAGNGEEPPDLQSSAPPVVIRPIVDLLVEKYQEMLAIYRDRVDELFKHDEEVSADLEPIVLAYEGDEKDRGVCDVMGTGSETVNKILATFAYLIGEVRSFRMHIDCEVLHPIIMYGERPDPTLPELKDGDKIIVMGRALGAFREAFEAVSYASALMVNILSQLYAVYRKKQPKGRDLYNTVFKTVHMHPLFDALGEVLGCIAKVDATVAANPTVPDHWDAYKVMITRIKQQGSFEPYGLDERQDRQLRRCLYGLDTVLMSGKCFSTCLSQKALLPLIEEKNKEMRTEFENYFLMKIEKIRLFADTIYESNESLKYMELVCLYALYRKLFPTKFDEELYKYIWALQRKVPVIVFSGLSSFYPNQFIEEHCPGRPNTARDPKDISAYLAGYLAKRDEALPGLAEIWYEKFKIWSTHMDSYIMAPYEAGDPNGEKYMQARGRLLLQGVLMAMQIKSLVQTILTLHLDQSVGFKEENIQFLLRCVELVKAIKNLVHRKQAVAALSLNAVQRLAVSDIEQYFVRYQEKHYRRKNSQFDLKSAINFAFQIISSPTSHLRFDILRLLISILNVPIAQTEKMTPSLDEALWKADLLVHVDDLIQTTFDCSFMYWCKDILAPFIEYLYSDPCNIHRFKYLFAALEDTSEMTKLSRHEEAGVVTGQYATFILRTLQEKVLRPLSVKIEEDLRYHTHSVHIEGITKTNPMEKNTDYSWLLEAEAFSFAGHTIEFRQYVEDYLDEVFYNLTVLNMTDWKMYEEMRTLAWEKYRLNLSQVYLPCKTHDQGLDLLQLSKQLNSFVMEMKYNQLAQFFIQPTYEQLSHALTFNVTHVINSLRTHGLGTIHTVVNNTYRLLTIKFEVLTNLMKDDYVVSRLITYRKWYKQHGEAIDQLFPYEKAQEYAKSIRQLGRDKTGETFLDKFRKLVTHIGNAVGVIRMVKSATLNIGWTASQLVPNATHVPNFHQKMALFSPSTQAAARQLDQVLMTMSREIDYFSVLVQTFQKVVKTTIEQRFLSNFYMAVPALTISFVETMMLAKNKLHDRKAFDMYFSDDGFPLGIAFILKVLDQELDFESLHWFESVHLELETRYIKEKNKPKKGDNQKILEMAITTVRNQQAEFALLSQVFKASKHFFSEI